MLKKTLENHRKIDKKSMKKPAVFLIDFLIDFWTVFRKVLGHVLALKFDEKCIEKLMKILIDFSTRFWMKIPPKWEAWGTPKSRHFVDISWTFRDPVPGTPPGRQMELK